ncbi:hypothetical protein [Caulobacter sp. LARHSG274]
MVFRATGIVWLALMMQAERIRRGEAGPGDRLDSEWLLHGPTDPDVVETAEPPITLLAAE